MTPRVFPPKPTDNCYMLPSLFSIRDQCYLSYKRAVCRTLGQVKTEHQQEILEVYLQVFISGLELVCLSTRVTCMEANMY